MKLVIIFGAGASVQAGLPTSADLIKDADKWVLSFEGDWKVFKRAYFWAKKEMARRLNPGEYGNIEMLANILDDADSYSRMIHSDLWPCLRGPARRIQNSYCRLRERAYRGFYQFTKDRNVTLSVYGELLEGIRTQIPHWLQIHNNVDLSYLRNLLVLASAHPDETVIATLNYDEVIEKACQEFSLGLTDGVDHWLENNRKLVFAKDNIQLLKLHGSLNWKTIDERVLQQKLKRHGDKVSEISTHRRLTLVKANELDRSESLTTHLVFGGKNKMTPVAPFFSLYSIFRERVMDSQIVVNFGYSGADPHVNEVLRDWGYGANKNCYYLEATRGSEAFRKIFHLPDRRLKFIKTEFGTIEGLADYLNNLLKKDVIVDQHFVVSEDALKESHRL